MTLEIRCPGCQWQGSPDHLRRDTVLDAPLCPRCGAACNTVANLAASQVVLAPAVPTAAAPPLAQLIGMAPGVAWSNGYLEGLTDAASLFGAILDGSDDSAAKVVHGPLETILGQVRSLMQAAKTAGIYFSDDGIAHVPPTETIRVGPPYPETQDDLPDEPEPLPSDVLATLEADLHDAVPSAVPPTDEPPDIVF